ncbi:hypothetical protein [Nocardia sp. NPDC049707]|uniref:hypothetical protein n=1 Tax=Nocardia sp. NPDC049707 TaxID=3154735 RepID=UPI00341663D3
MAIARGPIFQWVVRDKDAAQREFTERYGVAKWFPIQDVHFGPRMCQRRKYGRRSRCDSPMPKR